MAFSAFSTSSKRRAPAVMSAFCLLCLLKMHAKSRMFWYLSAHNHLMLEYQFVATTPSSVSGEAQRCRDKVWFPWSLWSLEICYEKFVWLLFFALAQNTKEKSNALRDLSKSYKKENMSFSAFFVSFSIFFWSSQDSPDSTTWLCLFSVPAQKKWGLKYLRTVLAKTFSRQVSTNRFKASLAIFTTPKNRAYISLCIFYLLKYLDNPRMAVSVLCVCLNDPKNSSAFSGFSKSNCTIRWQCLLCACAH